MWGPGAQRFKRSKPSKHSESSGAHLLCQRIAGTSISFIHLSVICMNRTKKMRWARINSGIMKSNNAVYAGTESKNTPKKQEKERERAEWVGGWMDGWKSSRNSNRFSKLLTENIENRGRMETWKPVQWSPVQLVFGPVWASIQIKCCV